MNNDDKNPTIPGEVEKGGDQKTNPNNPTAPMKTPNGAPTTTKHGVNKRK